MPYLTLLIVDPLIEPLADSVIFEIIASSAVTLIPSLTNPFLSSLSKLITWASPSNFLESIINISEQKLNSWKEKGVAYVYNGRTKQNMPINYQFYEDSNIIKF